MMKRHEVVKMFQDKVDSMDGLALVNLGYDLDMDLNLFWDEEEGYFLVDDEILQHQIDLDAKAEAELVAK